MKVHVLGAGPGGSSSALLGNGVAEEAFDKLPEATDGNCNLGCDHREEGAAVQRVR